MGDAGRCGEGFRGSSPLDTYEYQVISQLPREEEFTLTAFGFPEPELGATPFTVGWSGCLLSA